LTRRVSTLLAGILVFALPWGASAQSFVNLATSEDERRQSNREGRRQSASFTNVGGGDRCPTSKVLVRCYCVKSETPRDRPPSYLTLLKEQDQRRALTWDNKWKVHRASYRQYSATLTQLRLLKKACDTGGVSVYWREPYGNQWSAPSWGLGASICETIPKEIYDTALEIERLQARASEDARKLRIYPGLARFE